MLAYNQMSGNLTAQAATMRLAGAPNDIIQNLNPIAIIILVPVCELFARSRLFENMKSGEADFESLVSNRWRNSNPITNVYA